MSSQRLAKFLWRFAIGIVAALVLINVRLIFQKSQQADELRRLETRFEQRYSTIVNAKSKSQQLRQRAAKNRARKLTTAKMSEWIRTREEFLVRSGEQIVAQFVNVDYDHQRLVVYLPNLSADKNRYRIMFAFKEVWGAEHRPQNAALRKETPKSWKNKVELPIQFGEVQQFDFVQDQDSGNLNVLVDGQLIKSFSGRPSKARGSAFGSRFTMGYPGQILHPTINHEFACKTGEQLSLLNHATDLFDESQRAMGGRVLRCWVEAEQAVVPLNQFAESFAAYRAALMGSFGELLAGQETEFQIVGHVLRLPESWAKSIRQRRRSVDQASP